MPLSVSEFYHSPQLRLITSICSQHLTYHFPPRLGPWNPTDVGMTLALPFSARGPGRSHAPTSKSLGFPCLWPRELCPEFAGLWWGRHEATLRAPGALGRECGPSNSYQKLIISAVLGTRPSISLYPQQVLCRCIMGRHVRHCSFAFKCNCSSPANCFSWAPLPG